MFRDAPADISSCLLFGDRPDEGGALSAGRQYRELRFSRSSPYLLPLLVDVEMIVWEDRTTHLDASTRQVDVVKTWCNAFG
jgi:hypothetical protein